MRRPAPEPGGPGVRRALLILTIALAGCGAARAPGPAAAERAAAERLLREGRAAEALPHLLATLERWPTHLPSLRGLRVAAAAGHRPYAEYRALVRAAERRPLPRDLAARLRALRVERAQSLLPFDAPRTAAADLAAARSPIPPELAWALADDDLVHLRGAAALAAYERLARAGHLHLPAEWLAWRRAAAQPGAPGVDREALGRAVLAWAEKAPAVGAAAARAYLSSKGQDAEVLRSGLVAALSTGDEALARELDAANPERSGSAAEDICRRRARPGTSPTCRALRAEASRDELARDRWIAVCRDLGIAPGDGAWVARVLGERFQSGAAGLGWLQGTLTPARAAAAATQASGAVRVALLRAAVRPAEARAALAALPDPEAPRARLVLAHEASLLGDRDRVIRLLPAVTPGMKPRLGDWARMIERVRGRSAAWRWVRGFRGVGPEESLASWAVSGGDLGAARRASLVPGGDGVVEGAFVMLGAWLVALDAGPGLAALQQHWATADGSILVDLEAEWMREAVDADPAAEVALTPALAPAASGDVPGALRRLDAMPWTVGREVWRARLLSRQGQTATAREVLLGLAEATIDGVANLKVVEQELRLLGDREGARRLGEALYERQDPDGPGLGWAAQALAFAGRPEGAELVALDLAARSADPPAAFMKVAAALADAGHIDRAAALANRAIEWTRGGDEDLAVRLHTWLVSAGRNDDAGRVAAFLRARVRDPLDREACEQRFLLASAWSEPKLNPELLARARTAARAGRGPAARAWLALAVAVAPVAPSRAGILLSGAALAHRAGERETAARLVVKALGVAAPTRACLMAALRPGSPPDPLRIVSSESTPCD